MLLGGIELVPTGRLPAHSRDPSVAPAPQPWGIRGLSLRLGSAEGSEPAKEAGRFAREPVWWCPRLVC